MKLTVTFTSRGKSRHQWTVIFDLGSTDANALAAVKYAWDMNASITETHDS